MAPIPSCATTFLCAKSPAFFARLLTSNMQSPIPALAESCELLPAVRPGKGFSQGASAIATDAAGRRYLTWLLRLLIFSFFGICHFFVCGRRRQKMPSAFSHPAPLSRGRWQLVPPGSWSSKGGTRAGLLWGQSPSQAVSQSHHQRFGDRAPLRVLPAAARGGGGRQVAAGSHHPHHTQARAEDTWEESAPNQHARAMHFFTHARLQWTF